MENRLYEIEKLYARWRSEPTSESERCTYLLKIYHDLILFLSETSQLHFNTLFARVSFILTRYPLSKAWRYAMQIPRRELLKREMMDKELLPIVQACVDYLLILSRAEMNGGLQAGKMHEPMLPTLPPTRKKALKTKSKARVVALEWDPLKKLLTVLDEDEPDIPCYLQYDVHGVNDIFTETLELAIREIGLPLILGLTDVECTPEHVYIPSYIILLPDLLMDVTSIAQMHMEGADPVAPNLLDLFLPSRNMEALLIGHVANYLLDELIRDDTRSFDSIFMDAFKVYPIEFVRLQDDILREMQKRLKRQYANILLVIHERFPSLGIDRPQCMIEPSFFSPLFGIKGRLDLYFEQEKNKSSAIIELKSSKPFKPNSYGLSSSHYHQTLLYDLLIRSSHAGEFKRSNFILYSEEERDTLRYAVSVEAIQKETIHNRNQLVLLQFRMMQLDTPGARDIFKEIDPALFGHLKGFLGSHVVEWHKVYSVLSVGEQRYFKSFAAFITREHMIARIGSERGDGTGGLAGLWLDSIESKESRYEILRHLILQHIEKEDRQTILHFKRSESTNPLANFRAGDIAVMYPDDPNGDGDPTHFQLHRSTVIAVDAHEVVVRLRNMQIHTGHIEQVAHWNLEHDLLDSSFRSLYQSLWLLMASKVAKRHAILGLVQPQSTMEEAEIPIPGGLTAAQQRVYVEGINASSLYMLWGPPGTGKTSMMLKSWVWYYIYHTPARLVLLAYTNRAVDEICEALHNLGGSVAESYIRIGSRSATGEAYRHRLLDQSLESVKRRSQIKELLQRTRIYVGTIASLQGKSELFQLINVDVAIMDEASQLLDPAIVGLLTRFEKTILIGDHMQLPAVSAQPLHLSRIRPEETWNQKIGLTDMSMSYFERMFRLYQRNGWFHSIGTLCEQGRMHADIMEYVNRHVYNGILEVVHRDQQTAALTDVVKEVNDPLCSSRLVFIPSGSDRLDMYSKTNLEEAKYVLWIIEAWQRKLSQRQLPWSIGVITPFRAQIAAIQHLAFQQGVNMEGISVDTVERYQGGARDIIIMSCAVNAPSMLSRIVSVNTEGIERKLNVAVTRARQQFVLIGQEAILRSEPSYAALIQMCVRVDSLESIQ